MKTTSTLVVNVDEWGAKGDYNPSTGVGTDDSTAFQNALTYARSVGGGIVEFGQKKYKLGASIYIPVGVTLRGPNHAGQSGLRNNQDYAGVFPDSMGGIQAYSTGINFRTMTGALWVCFDCGVGDGTATYNVVSLYNSTSGAALPNYAVRTAAIYVGGVIENARIFQYSYTNNPGTGYTDSTNWNKTWNSGYMTGLALRQYGEEACFRNLLIGGFLQGILCYLESAPKIDSVLMDCMNGIEVSSCYDTAMIRNVHAFPLSALMGGANGSTVRRGVFLYSHDTNDWCQWSNCFSYGHKFGVVCANVTGNQFSNIGVDDVGVAAEAAGSYGFIHTASANQTQVSNFRCANREFGVYHNAGFNIGISNIGAVNVNTGIYVGSGNLYATGIDLSITDAAATGVKVGVNNAGAGTVKVLGAISGATSNTLGVVTVL